jgi:GT2 family glycosyltransferase
MPGRPQDVQLRIAGPDGGDIKVAIRPELQEQRTAPAVAQPAPSPEPELAGSSANVPVANGTTEWNGYAETAWRIRKPPARDPAALGFTLALRGADLVEVVRGLRFPTLDDPPKISVVIPCYGQDLYTAECIASIHAALPKNFGVEIVVADNASGGPFYEALHEHPGICTLRFPENRGFGPACNAAAEAASGEYLFLLNNDAQVAPGTFETLAASFESWPGEVGALGPKLLSFDGTLQEAGCRLHPDGTGTLVGFGADHREPRFNYRRRVEHVSGAAVMIRRDTFLELGGFDPLFAPAYCEDADLSLKLRARGMDIVYEPAAIVAHHLSGTSNAVDRINSDVRRSKRQRVAANRLSLVTRWADVLSETGLRTIALYLPQYHPVPQNDLWWGKGFTDWRNLATAKPKFRGHPQPRTPADLGYYDLRLPEVMTAQAELAKRYGISGFCYYYYWFSGQKILETPIERLLASGTPDLPFCICWANENWTRRWDGREDAVLMKQDYDESQAAEFAEAVAPILAAKTYIKVSGRPILLIYRVKEIPGPKRFIDVIRNVCRTKGVGEITVAMVESFDLSARPEPPHSYGCDITVEFPAHGMVHDPAIPVERLDPEWNGAMHDYRELAGAFMTRPEAGFKRLRSVLVGWDSTPRHPTRSLVLGHATPGAFQAWLEWTYRRTLEQNTGDERVVFINAWNEWCEGSYLEPDMRFGHAYLQAVRNALEAAAEVSHVFVP